MGVRRPGGAAPTQGISVALQHEPEQQKLLVVPPYGFQVTKTNSHMYLILELTIAGNSLGSAS